MSERLEMAFSRLREEGYRVTSPKDEDYNCIAWAFEKKDNWWWPDENSYWPSKPPEPDEITLETFIEEFAALGYEKCDARHHEAGYQKIALYAKNGNPTHAARQLSSGKWTSKCGKFEDIQHDTLEGICGDGQYEYGYVAVVMRRPKSIKRRKTGGKRNRGRLVKRNARKN